MLVGMSALQRNKLISIFRGALQGASCVFCSNWQPLKILNVTVRARTGLQLQKGPIWKRSLYEWTCLT